MHTNGNGCKSLDFKINNYILVIKINNIIIIKPDKFLSRKIDIKSV